MSVLSIIPYCLFSCSNNSDYGLVTFDILKEKYEPIISNYRHPYSEVKEYLTDLPFLIPGDRIKINFTDNEQFEFEKKPKSYQLKKANYTYIIRESGICGISHNFRISKQNGENVKTKFDWSYFNYSTKVINTDLTMNIIEYDFEMPDECYLTYCEDIKNDGKYVIQSIWEKNTFEKYYLTES